MESLGSDQLVFLLMVAVAVFLMAQAFIVPTFGENRQTRKRLRARLKSMAGDAASDQAKSLLREKYLRELAPWERRLEKLPGMERLALMVEQAGLNTPAYRILVAGVVLGATSAYIMHLFMSTAVHIPLLFGVLMASLPVFWLRSKRAKRLGLFEEQLPEALTVAARALRAGHPFSESLQLVSEEMTDPVATEFGMVFNQINYGGEARQALFGLLERVPSVTVIGLVSSLLVQRETGGNLAELLEKLASLIRERFHLQRHLQTLSAQGRMSAWVLSLMPFVMGFALSIVLPDYFSHLIKDPVGRTLIGGAFVLMVVGIFWLSRIVRIDI